jgi:cobalt/nickel transport protein
MIDWNGLPTLIRPLEVAMSRTVASCAVALALVWQTLALAHFHMLFPQMPSTATDKPVTLVFQWGHPFEHELFDADAPKQLLVKNPDGSQTDLTRSLQKITLKGADQKDVAAYQLAFTPEKRGDYTFVATAAPVWMEHEKHFLQDSAKVVLHVQTQKNWDASTGAFELTPLTRPYGLQPGMIFQAQVLDAGKPVPGAHAEVELYHATTLKELPPDEQMTRAIKADPNGVLTCTLTEPGWWCITAKRDHGTHEHAGKSYPVIERATFWVHVDPKG